MKRTYFMAVLLITVIFSADTGFAHMGEGKDSVDKGEKYEIMMQGERQMMGGEGHMMYSPYKSHMSGQYSMGHNMMYQGHHGAWAHGVVAFFKIIFAGIFFWLLFSIHKSLKVIADSKINEKK